MWGIKYRDFLKSSISFLRDKNLVDSFILTFHYPGMGLLLRLGFLEASSSEVRCGYFTESPTLSNPLKASSSKRDEKLIYAQYIYEWSES